jgi:hypothetical protein
MRRKWAAPLLLLTMATGCAAPGDHPPHWRRIDPSAAEPPQRWQVPDDGFSETLAVARPPASPRPAPAS